MVDYSQETFIKNWNQAAKYLSRYPRFKNLARLPTDGICCGISFVLARCIRSGDEQKFYDIYNRVCETEPKDLAKNLKDTVTPVNRDLINFICEVSVLQTKQLESVSPTIEDKIPQDKWINIAKGVISANNHDRIGTPIVIAESTLGEEFDMVKNSEFNTLTSILSKVQNNQSLSISMIFNDLDEAHSILMYRSNDIFYLFDVNTGKKVRSDNVDEAAKELIYSVNLNYTDGEKKYTQFDRLWRSSITFKILSVTALMPIVFLALPELPGYV